MTTSSIKRLWGEAGAPPQTPQFKILFCLADSELILSKNCPAHWVHRVFFISCSGVKYTDKVETIALSNVDNRIISSRVLANAEEWRNSGVKLIKGNSYKISAKGRWRLGGLCNWTGPDGLGAHHLLCPYFESYNFIAGWPGSTLIAKIGKSGQPFTIGQEYEFEADTSDILFFRINEKTTNFDNEGFVTVNTTLSHANLSERFQAIPQKNDQAISYSTTNNWAVIIGISKYRYSGNDGLQNLIFADDDAMAFAKTLRSLGWHESHIRLLVNEDATQRNIMIALKSWLTKASSDDQIILFWAGHGFPDPEDPEKVYLACHDTDISIPATGYRMDEVRRALEEIGSKNVILLADTCHAGKLITRSDGNRGLSIVSNIKREVPKGWVFMVGADTDRQSIEHSSWANGAFTHSLVKGLNGAADGYLSSGPKDGIVTMGELRTYMNTAMPEETQKILGVAKHPVITTSTGDPDIWNLTIHASEK